MSAANIPEFEIKHLNFSFAMIENKLMWVNYEQKEIWELDASKIQDDTDERASKISWTQCECKSFSAQAIFQGISVEEFQDQGIRIHEVSEQSMIRKRKIPEPHD